MRDLSNSEQHLRELLAQRILVLDGAMGTMLQQRDNRHAGGFRAQCAASQSDDLPKTFTREFDLIVGPAAFGTYQGNYLFRLRTKAVRRFYP